MRSKLILGSVFVVFVLVAFISFASAESLLVAMNVEMSGNYTYDTVTVLGNGTITFNDSSLNISANTINVYGTIKGLFGKGNSGMGGASGSLGGGGGGGHAGSGGAGGTDNTLGNGGAGGVAYGSGTDRSVSSGGGSGGPGERSDGNNPGGGGGGVLMLRAPNMKINGTLNLDGAGGSAPGAPGGGGGGGGGGMIFLEAVDLNLSYAILSVKGGIGANPSDSGNPGGGGGGGAGRVKIYYESILENESLSYLLSGGAGGLGQNLGEDGSAGASGTYYLVQDSNLGFDQNNYPANTSLYVDTTAQVWSYSGEFRVNETTGDFSAELNTALGSCTADSEGYCTIPLTLHSDSVGEIGVSDINIYFNHTEYFWNLTDFLDLSTYMVRVKAFVGLLSSRFDESDGDFTISSIPNDAIKFNITDNLGNTVAWFGNEGNIVLKGQCFTSTTCSTNDGSSFILGKAGDASTAFINSTGDLCIESGDCGDFSATCNPSVSAFIIQGSLVNMSYIDFNGDLCLTGGLFENADL